MRRPALGGESFFTAVRVSGLHVVVAACRLPHSVWAKSFESPPLRLQFRLSTALPLLACSTGFGAAFRRRGASSGQHPSSARNQHGQGFVFRAGRLRRIPLE